MRRFSIALLGLVLGATAQAQWSVVSTQSEFSNRNLVEHRRVVVRSETGQEATLELGLFATKMATLRVLDQPNESREDLAAVMQREGCLAGVNGGYFSPENAPVGLLIADGRTVAHFAKAKLLSGVLAAKEGRVQIFRAAEFPRKAKWKAAVQCGPFLVENGRAIAGLEATRSARRTFALVTGAHAAIGFCSSVSLAELGKILATPGIAGELKTERALNLDGGSSSAFWFRDSLGSEAFSIPERKTVRDFVAIVPR